MRLQGRIVAEQEERSCQAGREPERPHLVHGILSMRALGKANRPLARLIVRRG